MRKIKVGEFAEWAAAVVRNLPRDVDPVFAQRTVRDNVLMSQLLREVFIKAPEALRIGKR